MENDDKQETDADLMESDTLINSHIWGSKKVLMIGLTLSIAIAFGASKLMAVNEIFRSSQDNGTLSSSDMYSVVFDAGSTGSRVFVFRFRYEGSKDDQQSYMLKLTKEVFMSIKPGISYYAYDPLQAAESLKPLLKKAEQNVPENFCPRTLLLFKATAGLRLLPQVKGKQIMSEVKNMFLKSSPFHLPNPDEVEVMGGSEEDTVWNDQRDSTAAALDLGGGSLQIAFEIPEDITADQICKDLIGEVFQLRLIRNHFTVHTHSFLKYGLKSAYLQIMGGTESDEEPAEVKRKKLSTPCFAPDFQSTWHHGSIDYIIVGEESNMTRLESCQHAVQKFVKRAGFKAVKALKQQELHLFSYFYDIARWAGLIQHNSHQALLTPSDFYASAEHHCQPTQFSQNRPFQCMNLLYVYSILTVGVKLPSTKVLHVYGMAHLPEESRIKHLEMVAALLQELLEGS